MNIADRIKDTAHTVSERVQSGVESAMETARAGVATSRERASSALANVSESLPESFTKMSTVIIPGALASITSRIPAALKNVRGWGPRLGIIGAGLAAAAGIGLVIYRRVEGRFPWEAREDEGASASEASGSRKAKGATASEPSPTDGHELSLDALRTDAVVADNLGHWNKDELYELAREADIPGRSGMSKDALISALGTWRSHQLN